MLGEPGRPPVSPPGEPGRLGAGPPGKPGRRFSRGLSLPLLLPPQVVPGEGSGGPCPRLNCAALKAVRCSGGAGTRSASLLAARDPPLAVGI